MKNFLNKNRLVRRMTTVLLLMVISFSSIASTGNPNMALKQAFDELQYSLTIEWDQKDKVFYNTKVEEFKKRLADLNKDGVSSQEMISFITSQMVDKNLANNISETYKIANSKMMTVDEVSELLTRNMGNSYQRGASWSGEATIAIGLVVILLAAMTAIVIDMISKGSCSGGSAKEVCSYPNASSGDQSTLYCETKDPCTGTIYNSYYSYNN